MNTTQTAEAPEIASTRSSATVQNNVTSKTVVITPTHAKFKLEHNNPRNRPLSEHHVDELVKEMVEGRWKFNGDPIREDDKGNIIDGQHRLAACVKSGISLRTILVKGLDSEVFDTIDAGKMRNASDVLALNGEHNPSRLASTLRFIQNILDGSPARKVKYTNTEIEAILNRNPSIRSSVAAVKDTEAKLLVPFPILAGCHYLFSRNEPILAEKVIQQIVSGSDLGEDDPIHVFRERMLQLQLGKHRPSPVYIAALLIKAWNQIKAAERGKPLTFRMGGKTPEKFPIIT